MTIEQISPNIQLFITELKGDNEGIGYLYQVLLLNHQRSVDFLIDITRCHNMRFDNETSWRWLVTHIDSNSNGLVDVARILIKDKDEGKFVDIRYSWIEKETVVQRIADGIELETTDTWAEGFVITSISYRVKSSFPLEFVADFTGSQNLKCVGSGNASISTAIVKEQNEWTQVGLVQISDPRIPWHLHCSYKWKEYVENRATTYLPDLREIAPGLFFQSLHESTAENVHQIHFFITCTHSQAVNYGIVFVSWENISFQGEDKETVTFEGKVQPWDRATIAIVSVTDINQPWSLDYDIIVEEKIKASGSVSSGVFGTVSESEDSISDRMMSLHVNEDEVETDPEPLKPSLRKLKVISRQSRKSSTLDDSVLLESDSSKLSCQTAGSPKSSARSNLRDGSLKWREISLGIFLITIEKPNEIIYQVQVHRAVEVTFHCNLFGSINMKFHPENPDEPSERSILVMPFTKVTVAHIKPIVNEKPWVLKCKFSWNESNKYRAPHKKILHHQSSVMLTIDEYLTTLGLEEYLEDFEREKVDLELLLQMQHDEETLRSTLKEIGVKHIGDREKIIMSLGNT